VGGAEMASSIRAHNAEHLPYLLSFTTTSSTWFPVRQPLLWTPWTLSIEEQFYLLWPLCVFLLARGRLAALCKLLVVAGPLIRLCRGLAGAAETAASGARPANFVYFLTSSHLDAFALGAC
jgi:peptidoglycan/LPS O-acetylase OafA/YrhL